MHLKKQQGCLLSSVLKPPPSRKDWVKDRNLVDAIADLLQMEPLPDLLPHPHPPVTISKYLCPFYTL